MKTILSAMLLFSTAMIFIGLVGQFVELPLYIMNELLRVFTIIISVIVLFLAYYCWKVLRSTP